ncbi:MAG: hypothetical protein KA164_04600 [Rhodoferax sp.]|nr:hypothetical protein [Rhodoferax sp.]
MAFRDPLQFHENPAVIAWWCRLWGRPLLWFAQPARRRRLLALLALGVGTVTSWQTLSKHADLPLPSAGWPAALVVLAQFFLLWLVYRAAQSFARLPAPVRRHPQWALHASYWVLLLVLWGTTPTAGLWRGVVFGLAILYPVVIWRCAYLVLAGQHGRMAGTGIQDHLLYLWPAYGGSSTPYGKGLAYLSQNEARTPEALARSQLGGLKLLLLAVVWRLVLTLFEGTVYGPGNGLTRATGGLTLGVPDLPALLGQGGVVAPMAGWASVYCQLFEDVLRMAIKGHLIVGMLRLWGFDVFRNTYKPLLAESVVEFWNRYFYYFKELLSTFFFMPTFTGVGRRLKQWPRLRLLAAVFAAAFVGNVYYHVIKDAAAMAQGQVLQVLQAHQSRMFYCLLLALGIFVSMLREQQRRGAVNGAGGAPRGLRIFGVWTFFSLISIWNTEGGAAFGARVHFFLGLFHL